MNEWNWFEAESTTAMQEGVAAYASVMQYLHPYDYAPMVMLRCLMRFQFFFGPEIQPAEQRRTITKFVDTTLLR